MTTKPTGRAHSSLAQGPKANRNGSIILLPLGVLDILEGAPQHRHKEIGLGKKIESRMKPIKLGSGVPFYILLVFSVPPSMEFADPAWIHNVRG